MISMLSCSKDTSQDLSSQLAKLSSDKVKMAPLIHKKKQHKRVYWKKLRPGIPQDPFLPAVIEEEENPMGPVQVVPNGFATLEVADHSNTDQNGGGSSSKTALPPKKSSVKSLRSPATNSSTHHSITKATMSTNTNGCTSRLK